VNTVIPRVQPTRSTITVACFVGAVWGRSRIRCSTRRLPSPWANDTSRTGIRRWLRSGEPQRLTRQATDGDGDVTTSRRRSAT
jgi:hypothetical protein